jgi:pyruvate formate lyase activating enzyme
VLPHVDWVGLDVKALPEDYDALTTRPGSGAAAWRSLALLLERGIALEVRITVDAGHFPPDRLDALLDRLRDAGVRQVVLQPCRDRQGRACVDAALLAGTSAKHQRAFRGLSVRG